MYSLFRSALTSEFSDSIFFTYSQALIICIGDFCIALFAGFSVFSVLGHVSFLKEQPLDSFRSTGYDIAFITFPETVAYLPLPQFWSVVFFLALFTFGFDSTVPCLEIVVTVLGDQFPALRKRRWLQVAIVVFPSFLVSLIYTFQGGMYVLTLVDWFMWGPPITIFAIFETVVIGWVFGIPRLSKATTEMYNCGVPAVLKILIKFVAPVLLLAITIYSMYAYRSPNYGGYIYPGWANAIGWIIVAVIILPMPIWIVYTVWKAKGETFKQKFVSAFRPGTVICRQKRKVKDKHNIDSEMAEFM